ncbi:MAG TPA: helix-turn-helix domain-containing protein [Ktedonobacterales bacterium]|nr:helix-turn-helix domain-containing protein [Ktedonobacterales bacterium]
MAMINQREQRSAPAPSRWLLTTAEAQHELHISRAFLFRLLARHELASITIGRRRMIPVTAIEAYIATRLAEGGEA